MTTRSLILHAHEVRAALDGRLGLVVRPVAHKLAMCFDMPRGPEDVAAGYPMVEDEYGDAHKAVDLCPLGGPGNKLWCRESYYIQNTHGQHRPDGLRWGSWSGLPTTISPDGKRIVYYKEGFDRCAPMWCPPATMPAWASRITLEVRGVRCCRTFDLTIMDARSAGIPKYLSEFKLRPYTEYEDDLWRNSTTLENMRRVWESKYSTRYPWETSWAWAVEVRRVER